MVPRLIHQVQLGPAKAGDDTRTELIRFFHQEWEFRMWGEDVTAILSPDWLELWESAEQRCANPILYRANLARYAILHKLGGVYIDRDFRWLRSLDSLDLAKSFIGRDDIGPLTGIIGAKPGRPFFVDLIERSRENPFGKSWDVNGVNHAAKVLADHPKVTVFGPSDFYPLNRRGEMTENPAEAYAVHLWAGQGYPLGLPPKGAAWIR